MMTSRSGTPVGLAHRWTARAAFADKVATTESTINPASANAARPRIHIPEIRPLAIIRRLSSRSVEEGVIHPIPALIYIARL